MDVYTDRSHLRSIDQVNKTVIKQLLVVLNFLWIASLTLPPQWSVKRKLWQPNIPLVLPGVYPGGPHPHRGDAILFPMFLEQRFYLYVGSSFAILILIFLNLATKNKTARIIGNICLSFQLLLCLILGLVPIANDTARRSLMISTLLCALVVWICGWIDFEG